MMVGTLSDPLFRIIDRLEKGEFYLQAIAVDPDQRGAGIGGVHLDHIDAEAKAGDSVLLVLDVSAKNPGAKRLYERRGFEAVSKWPKRRWVPGIRLLRMAKVL